MTATASPRRSCLCLAGPAHADHVQPHRARPRLSLPSQPCSTQPERILLVRSAPVTACRAVHTRTFRSMPSVRSRASHATPRWARPRFAGRSRTVLANPCQPRTTAPVRPTRNTPSQPSLSLTSPAEPSRHLRSVAVTCCSLRTLPASQSRAFPILAPTTATDATKPAAPCWNTTGCSRPCSNPAALCIALLPRLPRQSLSLHLQPERSSPDQDLACLARTSWAGHCLPAPT